MIINMISGKIALICDSKICSPFLSLHHFINGNDEKKTKNWLITLQMHHNLNTKIVNKKHFKYKQIIKVINILVENGIINHREYLCQHGHYLLFYIFEKLIDPKFYDEFRNKIYKTRNQVTFDELSNVFILFLLILPFSLLAFIIEIIYFHLIK